MTTSDLFRLYTEAGTPHPFFSYNGGAVRHAILVYERFMAWPQFEREPTRDELRTLVEYCAYFIEAPCWVIPADEIRILRQAIPRITTPWELAGWLWGCKTIGIGPVWGVS